MASLHWFLGTTLIAASMGLYSSSAAAALISVDDPRFGPGSVTHDTATNLRWLDLTITAGSSWLEVEAELAEGGLYAGFRHATLQEVWAFFEATGIDFGSEIGSRADPELYARALDFRDLVGVTWPSAEQTRGTVDLWLPMEGLVLAAIHPLLIIHPDGFVEQAIVFGDEIGRLPPDQRDERAGHFLVAPVPEPGTAALLAAGMALTAVLRRAARTPRYSGRSAPISRIVSSDAFSPPSLR
jgi:hypothetical protein